MYTWRRNHLLACCLSSLMVCTAAAGAVLPVPWRPTPDRPGEALAGPPLPVVEPRSADTSVLTVDRPLTEADIEALRALGQEQGWTFTVGQNPATQYPLSRLCGSVLPPDWRERGKWDESRPTAALPSNWDWRAHAGVTPVRDQEDCGSCWAFAAVGALEASMLIESGISTDLSEQWLVSCTYAGSCWGGFHGEALSYMQCAPLGDVDLCGDSGAVLETAFPYVAYNVECDCPYAHPYCLNSWYFIGNGLSIPTVQQIKHAIYTRGPVAVGIYANDAFAAYTGGVFNGCQSGQTNHAVVLVGWDDSQGSEGVWILKNSWGSYWGENGYMRIAYGCCRVGEAAAYVNYLSPDCNHNGTPDSQDILNGTSQDCNTNGVPDECELGGDSDCNSNGTSDVCDLLAGTSRDCNANGLPDECDIASGVSEDCNGNGRPDECEVPQEHVFANTTASADGASDVPGVWIGDDLRLTSPGLLHEVALTLWNDSSSTLSQVTVQIRFLEPDTWRVLGSITNIESNIRPGIYKTLRYTNLESLGIYLPEEVVAAAKFSNNFAGVYLGQMFADPPTIGSSEDVFFFDPGGDPGWYWFHGNPVANFYWDVIVGTPDCNGNGVPDGCDLTSGASPDANANGVPDECDPDCNSNGIPDDLDLINGTSIDCDWNSRPDECDIASVDVLVGQTPSPTGMVVAQAFDDAGLPEFSSKAWDDFTLSRATQLMQGQASFSPPDWVGFYYEVPFLVEVADVPGGAEAGGQVALSVTGHGDFFTGLVTWDFGGATLPAGTWWLSVQATGGYWLYGQTWWRRSNLDSPSGSEHYFHNPGGGFGIGVMPKRMTEIYPGEASPADLAFTQYYVADYDCNGNQVPDSCDISSGLSQDVNSNGVPDECDPDCNTNGIPDDLDIANQTSPDCNTNAVPDECDLASGHSGDCNTNGLPDECESGISTQIDLQPSSHSGCTGTATSFAVVASGLPPLRYQWRKNGQPIPGATEASLTIDPVTLADAGDYDVVVRNGCDDVATSNYATLDVLNSPSVSTPPADVAVQTGQPAVFAVDANGSEPIWYQWRKDGLEIYGAWQPWFYIPYCSPTDSGLYDVIITNSCGWVVSESATLIVHLSSAAGPQPSPGAIDVPTRLILDWADVEGAETYDVYFGTTNPPPLVASVGGSRWQPPELSYEVIYYWKVTARNSYTGTDSEVWSFRTRTEPLRPPDAATPIWPPSSATNVAVTVQFDWSDAPRASTYRLLVGTDTKLYARFLDATAINSYWPQTLTLAEGTTYYWQVYSENATGVAKSPIWSFTTYRSPTYPQQGQDTGQDQPAVTEPNDTTDANSPDDSSQDQPEATAACPMVGAGLLVLTLAGLWNTRRR